MGLIDEIGEPAMLEQLAEECAELAHACLKLARVERGNNPTPETEKGCVGAIIEEAADVEICIDEITKCEWWRTDDYVEMVNYKRWRMQNRMAEGRG